MREFKLRLSNSSELLELDLHDQNEPEALSSAMELHKGRVYYSSAYEGELKSSFTRDVRGLEVLVNEYPVNITFLPQNGLIYFNDPVYKDRIFLDSYGLCQIKLIFHCNEGPKVLVSDRFTVMVRQSAESEYVSNMGVYTARHSSFLLYGTKSDYVKKVNRWRKGAYSLEDKVRQLKKSAAILESNWRSIHLNPRKNTITTDQEADLSRNPSAYIQKLASSPGLLAPSNSTNGIRIGNTCYLPQTTRIHTTFSGTDVYENQCILAFIRDLYSSIQQLMDSISQTIQALPLKIERRDEYVSSSSFMFQAAALSLDNTLEDLKRLQSIYSSLYAAYSASIPARAIHLQKLPLPTNTFLKIPAYRQIYELMSTWYEMADVRVLDLRFMQTFLQITTLYEVYVLTKLGTLFEGMGFQRVSSRFIQYEFETETLYENSSINNIYEYVRDDVKVTLYYQPVIYDRMKRDLGVVELYRSTSISFPKGWAEPARGRYYTPDYVIRLEKEGHDGARWIIGDAKYTNYRNTRDHKVIPLVWKYLYSLACQKPNDKITGLYIFHGKSPEVTDMRRIIHSVYDLKENPHQEFPQTEIITLNESNPAAEALQMKALASLMELQLDFSHED